MSFALSWLSLREAADRAARDRELLQRAVGEVVVHRHPVLVDLGAGTGAMMRAMDCGAVRWRLVDHDADLLAEARRRAGDAVETILHDLRDIGTVPLDNAALVTSSALLDLVSASWIGMLVSHVRAIGAAVYSTLNYDGAMAWTPSDPDDAWVLEVFNQHQRQDKGFGPALGPDSGSCLAKALLSAGYEVRRARSPWRLGTDSAMLHAALLEGVAAAAMEAGLDGARGWLARRLSLLAEGATCQVGHVDVLALPGKGP